MTHVDSPRLLKVIFDLFRLSEQPKGVPLITVAMVIQASILKPHNRKMLFNKPIYLN